MGMGIPGMGRGGGMGLGLEGIMGILGTGMEGMCTSMGMLRELGIEAAGMDKEEEKEGGECTMRMGRWCLGVRRRGRWVCLFRSGEGEDEAVK